MARLLKILTHLFSKCRSTGNKGAGIFNKCGLSCYKEADIFNKCRSTGNKEAEIFSKLSFAISNQSAIPYSFQTDLSLFVISSEDRWPCGYGDAVFQGIDLKVHCCIGKIYVKKKDTTVLIQHLVSFPFNDLKTYRFESTSFSYCWISAIYDSPTGTFSVMQ